MNNRSRMLLACLFSAWTAGSAKADEPLKQLSEHMDLSLRIRVDAYPWKPGSSVVPAPVIESSTLNTVLLFDWKTWTDLSERTRFDTAGWFEYGVPYNHRWQGGVDLFQDDQNLSRPLVFNELYTTTRAGPVDLVAGRTIRRNTLAILYPLADRYVARDFNDPVNPKILGIWQARIDAYAGKWEGSFAVLPIFQPPKVPGIESRWWLRDVETITGVPFPDGGNGEMNIGTPGVSVENTAVTATLRTRRSRCDFFTTVYHGLSSYAVTRLNQPTPTDYFVELEYVPGFEWSGGVSTTISVLELHSEAIYHRTDSGRDDEYIQALGGFLWQLDHLAGILDCNQIHLAAEYAREHILSEQDPSFGYASSSEPFRFGRNTLFTELMFEVSERNSAALGIIYDFEPDNVFSRIRASHRFGNGNRLDAMLDVFEGDNLYFGTWDRNKRLSVVYQIYF